MVMAEPITDQGGVITYTASAGTIRNPGRLRYRGIRSHAVDSPYEAVVQDGIFPAEHFIKFWNRNLFSPGNWWMVELESFGFDCPSFADELEGCESFEGVQSPSEIVGADEVGEMPAELLMAVLVVAFDGRVLDGSVYPFDLTVAPGMVDLGEAVLDVVLAAAHGEHVCHRASRRAGGVAWRITELDAVVGQDRVDLVRHGCDQAVRKAEVVTRFALSTRCTKANLLVRSMATNK
jgi:hypothetical protein